MKKGIDHAFLWALTLVLGAATCYADPVTLTFDNVGGAYTGGEYIYPYYFTISNGTSTTTDVPMMCIRFDRHNNFGQSWGATVTTAGALGTNYEEAAYFAQLAKSGGANAADAQLAAWELFDPADPALSSILTAGAGQLLANISSVDLSSYASSLVYLPDDASYDGPQTFINPVVTPEPGTWALVGTGFLVLLGIAWSRKRPRLIADLRPF